MQNYVRVGGNVALKCFKQSLIDINVVNMRPLELLSSNMYTDQVHL